MKKTKQIAGLLLFSGILSLCTAYIQKKEELKPVAFTKVEGRAWVDACLKKYPEIGWLADRDVRKTEEGRALEEMPYSEQIYGEKFIEFDRTIMTLRCMKLFLNGGSQAYEELTKGQPDGKRLSKESFEEIHQMASSLIHAKYEGLSSEQIVSALETALVLGDMGKSPKARAIFLSQGITAPDHDDFYADALAAMLQNSELSSSFSHLPIAAQQLLVKAAGLIHYGHVTHCEGGEEMFAKLKKSSVASSDPFVLSFDCFVHLCDVAGAAGHVNKNSSLMCTQDTYRALKATYDACHILSDPQKEERNACEAYVARRASWLGFDPSQPIDYVLTRVSCMLRFFTPQEGERLKQAFLQLSEKERLLVMQEFAGSYKRERTPTYMPAVLLNLYNFNPKLSLDERMELAVSGLPFLAKVLQAGNRDAQVPLNFNKAAGAVKEDPERVKYADFEIDPKTQEVVLHPVRA